MLKCSHILCKVDNLQQGVADLEQAGFSVQWGGKPGEAHNALVWFEQGPFLEFFELPRAFCWLSYPFGWRFGRAAGARLRHWARAPAGWCDVALEPDHYQPADPLNLENVTEHLRHQMLARSRIVKGSRLAGNGEKVHYRFIAPADRHLPFIVSHYHPLQRPSQITHANGARSVARIHFHLPGASHASLQRLLPDDNRLHAQISARRQVSSVTLSGWQAQAQTSCFIRSLFTVPQEAQ